MIPKKYCCMCKTTTGVLSKKNDRPQYICRKCNTELCKKYRQTKKGKAAVSRANRRWRTKNNQQAND